MERVFDICHGCRRCVSLCQSFPTLFDLVDATARRRGARRRQEGLLEGRRPVLPVRPLLHDQVPVRAAAPVERRLPAPDAARQGDQVQARARSSAGEKLLASTDVHGQFAGIPIVVQAVNAVNRTKPVRKLMDSALGVHPDAWLPDAGDAALPLERAPKTTAPRRSTDGERTPGQGGDLLDLLRQLQRARHRPRPAQGARAQRRSRT